MSGNSPGSDGWDAFGRYGDSTWRQCIQGQMAEMLLGVTAVLPVCFVWLKGACLYITVTSSPHPYTWKRKYPLSKYPAQARFDRQIYSGSISNCSYSLVGCESIPEMNEFLVKSCGYRTPSDHFGVLCRYQLLGIIQQVLSISSSPLVPEDTCIGRPTKQICLRPPEVVDLT